MSDATQSTPTVEYREVPGFPGYRVSNTGVPQSRRPRNGRGPLSSSWRDMNPITDSKGRLFVYFCRDRTRVMKYIHILVLELFVGPKPSPDYQACHFPDRNPLNNNATNLMWGTRKDNAKHAIIHGTQICGEKCHTAKLSVDKVRAIRKEHAEKKCTFASLGKKYGIAHGNIRLVVLRRTWAHVQ